MAVGKESIKRAASAGKKERKAAVSVSEEVKTEIGTDVKEQSADSEAKWQEIKASPKNTTEEELVKEDTKASESPESETTPKRRGRGKKQITPSSEPAEEATEQKPKTQTSRAKKTTAGRKPGKSKQKAAEEALSAAEKPLAETKVAEKSAAEKEAIEKEAIKKPAAEKATTAVFAESENHPSGRSIRFTEELPVYLL